MNVLQELVYYFRDYLDYRKVRDYIETYIHTLLPNDPFMIIALNEAMNNALFHGNEEDENKFVTLKIKVVNLRRLILRIKDEGSGFPVHEWKHLIHSPQQQLEKNKSCDSGRGLALMTHAADRVYFNRIGNEVLIMKEISDQHHHDIVCNNFPFTMSDSEQKLFTDS